MGDNYAVKTQLKYLIGIDEAGRGPIAGPVSVGACAFLTKKAAKLFKGVKESKQLTEEQRETWYQRICRARDDGHVNFFVTMRSHRIIDARGLSYAIRTGLLASIESLGLNPAESLVLLDGGLRAPKHYINQKTIIKGDEKEVIIALASICAKVTRDRKMREWGRRHPEYKFEIHKGYGTPGHYKALKRYGILPIHRMSFLKGIV